MDPGVGEWTADSWSSGGGIDVLVSTSHRTPVVGFAAVSACVDVVGLGSGRCLRRRAWRGGRGESGTYFLCENCDVLQMTDAGPQWSAGERSCRMEGTFSTAMAASSAGMGAASRCEGAAAACREPAGSR